MKLYRNMQNIPVRHIHPTRMEPGLSGSFAIRDVRSLLDGKDMIQEYHRHDFFFILTLKKGNGDHEIDFTAYDVDDYSVFFMRPGQIHRLTLKAGSTGYLMQFKNDFFYPHDATSRQLWRRAGSRNLYPFDAARFKKLLSVLTYIFQEHTDQQEGYQEIIKANLSIFFIELVRQGHHREKISQNSSHYKQDRLDEFLELVEANIAEHKLASYYAESLHISLYQLNAITKALLGKTGSELINEFIILEAKRYLLTTANQVNQIADHLGYDDVSYFIRFFKKHTGHSPEMFRNNFR